MHYMRPYKRLYHIHMPYMRHYKIPHTSLIHGVNYTIGL